MTAPVVLSVDGRGGSEIAGDRENHLRADRATAQLPGAVGRPGVDAPPATQGEPAGLIQAELSHSKSRQGGIVVRTINQRGSRKVAPVTEVPPVSKLLFSAVGGKGEPGRRGGDGEDGAEGQAGDNATRDTDGTDGADGGAGGAAGMGSDRAAGGNGGFVQLIVSEVELDLLYSVSCDVSRGAGGEAGEHGKPGKGGRGGSGGNLLVWESNVDHVFKCTPNCVGRSTDVALFANRPDATMEEFRRYQEEGRRQSTVNQIVGRALSVATRPRRGQTEGTGVCFCHGGIVNCPGCKEISIYRTMSRPGGKDGREGSRGNRPQNIPLMGLPGRHGQTKIIVRCEDGTFIEGESPFKLRLVGFDVEDENADGIYEPGENIFIRRIRVQNIGGLPSPPKPIACRLVSDDGSIVTAADSRTETYLPHSIPAESVLVGSGEIKARLALPQTSVRVQGPYKTKTSVGLSAVMSWTMLPIEDFDLTVPVAIQFPVQIAEIAAPVSMTSGTDSVIALKVLNKSKRPFGPSTGYRRMAKLNVRVDRIGELLDDNGAASTELTIPCASIPPGGTVEMAQLIRARPHAAAHVELRVSFRLFISTPHQTDFEQEPDTDGMQLVETRQVTIQSTAGYFSSPNDDVLIVTNSEVRKQDLDAVVSLFESELELQTKIWNVSTQGGLWAPPANGWDEVESVMADFEDKTVVFLGDSILLPGRRRMSTVALCDPLSMLMVSRHHTSCLFFGCANSDNTQRALDLLLRPVEGEVAKLMERLPATQKHKTSETLVKALHESSPDANRTHMVAVQRARLKSREKTISHAARELASWLTITVPLYHFSIGIVPAHGEASNLAGHLLVQRGLPRIARIQATQSELLDTAESSQSAGSHDQDAVKRPTRLKRTELVLSWYDKLSLIGALPIATRMTVLEDVMARGPGRLCNLIELSIERDVDNEIQRFVELEPRIKFKDAARTSFLRDCLPVTSSLVDYLTARDRVPVRAKAIIAHSFASCRAQSTGLAAIQTINPLSQTRKLIHDFLTQSLGQRIDLTSEKEALPNSRSVAQVLEGRVSEETGRAAYFQRLGSYGPPQSLRSNDVLTVDQWDSAARMTIDAEIQVIDMFAAFQAQREEIEARIRSMVIGDRETADLEGRWKEQSALSRPQLSMYQQELA